MKNILVNRVAAGKKRKRILAHVAKLQKIAVDTNVLTDIEQIAVGGFSPLTGFMKKRNYVSVLKRSRLSDGTPWSIPVTFSVSEKDASGIKSGQQLLITSTQNEAVAVIFVEEKFVHEKAQRCEAVYGTANPDHPGVAAVDAMGDVLLGGEIILLNKPKLPFRDMIMDPHQTRKIFKKLGWKTICAFHTRNAVHRAHEYLQRCALEFVDGLFINPIVGQTKEGDFSPTLVLESYRLLIRHYYPKARVLLAPLNMKMAFAGPREALFHAIVRKNYGCTHIVIGRDHAGVKGYYDTYAAHKIFDNFTDLGIAPLRFNGPFYCKKCRAVATEKTCSHPQACRIQISGTKIRKMFGEGMTPPEEFMRPEISQWIKKQSRQKGNIFK